MKKFLQVVVFPFVVAVLFILGIWVIHWLGSLILRIDPVILIAFLLIPVSFWGAYNLGYFSKPKKHKKCKVIMLNIPAQPQKSAKQLYIVGKN